MKDAPSLELAHYGSVLGRRWYVVLLGIIIGVGLALAYVQTAQRSVTATTTVSLNLITSQPFDPSKSAADLLDPVTEAQTATSSVVMSAVAKELGGTRSAQSVRANTVATLITKATVMKIRYTDTTRALAEKGADDIATQYLTYRGQLADARISASVTKLTDRRDTLLNDLVAANTQKASARPGSASAVQAESDRQAITLELNNVASQISTFQGIDTTGGTTLIGAGESAVTISPSKRILVGTGFGLGLILGLLGAFLVDRSDRRLRDQFDVRRAGGGDVLSELDGSSATLPASGKDVDAIRSLRERLLATLPGASPILAVADLTRGPSDLAANLAYAFCETGRRVDLVMPGASPAFLAALVDGFGLTDEGETEGVHLYSGGTLDVLVPAEGSLPVAGELFVADRLSDDSRRTDLTVIALPPKAERSQLLAAARLGHSLILVVSRRSTGAGRVSDLADELGAVGAVVHGTVLTPRNRSLKPAPAGDRPVVTAVPVSEEPVSGEQASEEPVSEEPVSEVPVVVDADGSTVEETTGDDPSDGNRPREDASRS